MSQSLKIYGTSQLIRVGKKLGSGGEGGVFEAVDNPNLVIKKYHKPPTAKHVEKLVDMVGLCSPSLLSISAWPERLLCDPHSQKVVGFTMPRLVNCEVIQSLYNPVQRMRRFPKATWKFQVRAAHNIAAAFDEVHRAGCLVGDVNQGNALVTPEATIRLVDCDSFQVARNGRIHLCEVGVPHFTPPELQGVSFRGRVRTQNHDRFGLAVLVYQLLFVGRHPYAGLHADESPFTSLIANYRFSQGPMAHTWGMKPPAFVPDFCDISLEMAMLFRRAFERGSEKDCRPTPSEWMASLHRFEDGLTECPSDSSHVYWRSAMRCVWCKIGEQGGPEYYYGASRGTDHFVFDESKFSEIMRRLRQLELCAVPSIDSIRQSIGRAQPRPFPPELLQIQAKLSALRNARVQMEDQFTAAKKKLQDELERRRSELKTVYQKQTRGLQRKLRLIKSNSAEQIDARRRLRQCFKRVSFAGIALLLAGLLFSVVWVGLLGLVLCPAIFIDIARSQFFPDKHEAEAEDLKQKHQRNRRQYANEESVLRTQCLQAIARLKQQLQKAVAPLDAQVLQSSVEGRAFYDGEIARLSGAIFGYRQKIESIRDSFNLADSISSHQVEQLKRKVEECVRDAMKVKPMYEDELSSLIRRSDETERLRHLRLHRIADARITGIGNERKSRLEYYGILTAADVSEDTVRGVIGFGDVFTARLLSWRDHVVRTFQPRGIKGVPADSLRQLVVRYRDVQQRLLSDASTSVVEIENIVTERRSPRNQYISEVTSVLEEMVQTEVDFQQLETVFESTWVN